MLTQPPGLVIGIAALGYDFKASDNGTSDTSGCGELASLGQNITFTTSVPSEQVKLALGASGVNAVSDVAAASNRT